MLMFTVFILSVIIVVHGVTEDGFTSECDSNNTLFAKKGEVATFQIETDTRRLNDIDFYKGILGHRSHKLFVITHGQGELLDVLHIEDRYNFTIPDRNTYHITLHVVGIEDSGIYMARGSLRYTKCWELLVLDIWNAQSIQTFEEYRPAIIHATPPASRLVRPRVNATATWLFDGLNSSETTDFLEQDGYILIVSTTRRMEHSDVTYRITEDNGVIHEVNLTISVTYGPDSYLQFSPATTFYTLTLGEWLPDITCFTDCHPACKIKWDRSGVDDVLSLGKVGPSSSGMYTCTATRNGSERVVERSIYVEITPLDVDNSPFIIAMSVLGTLQGLTMICLAVYAVWMYRTSSRSEGSNAHTTSTDYISQQKGGNNNTNRTNQQANEQTIATVELSHYEGLDNTLSNTNENYENLNIGPPR